MLKRTNSGYLIDFLKHLIKQTCKKHLKLSEKNKREEMWRYENHIFIRMNLFALTWPDVNAYEMCIIYT